MLKHSDLETFVELARRAEQEATTSPTISPDTVLRATTPSEDLLHRNELGQLRRSLKIASVAGDVPDSAHKILHTIVQDFSAESYIYLPLTHSKEWLDAITWALSDPARLASASSLHSGEDRQWVVGNACRALRDRGYDVNIGAFGPLVDASTRTRIARKVNSLFAQIGGIDAARRLFRILRETRKLHAGIWLFGSVSTSWDQLPRPAVPFGWLLSIALRNIHASPRTLYPAELWDSAVRLAIDFAASTDCQHYNRFDGTNLDAPDFLPTLVASLEWRELFTLVQVPTSVLPILRQSLSQIDWPNDTDDLSRNVDRLFGELDRLLNALHEDRLSVIQRANVRFPLLWAYARAPKAKVNSDYLDPFGKQSPNHERYVFFEASSGKVIALPPTLTAAAGCETIFSLIWKVAGQDVAGKIVGKTIEKAVFIACRAHTANVWENITYQDNDGADLEIDVAAREGQELVLFECKTKALTRKARTRDLMEFIDNYTKSFLYMLGQLVRHDQNIKCGRTPLTQDSDDLNTLQVRKIAVSPLSYGPVSDHVLINSLMRSIAQVRLNAVQDNPCHSQIVENFNKSVEKSIQIIEQIAPQRDGRANMFGYLMRISWFDLGQLLYALHRGRSLTDAISAVSHLTFSTRDFWTESALADREGLTKSKWHPISDDEATN